MSDDADVEAGEDPDTEGLSDAAERLADRAAEIEARLDRWETGEDAGSDGDVDLATVLADLDRWHTSRDDGPGSGTRGDRVDDDR